MENRKDLRKQQIKKMWSDNEEKKLTPIENVRNIFQNETEIYQSKTGLDKFGLLKENFEDKKIEYKEFKETILQKLNDKKLNTESLYKNLLSLIVQHAQLPTELKLKVDFVIQKIEELMPKLQQKKADFMSELLPSGSSPIFSNRH